MKMERSSYIPRMFAGASLALKKKIALILGGLIMLSACVLVLYHLGNQPLYDYDEATYAEVTHELVASGAPLSLTYRGLPYFDKPPLYFWLAGIADKAFGENEFSMRLPSALSFVALIGVAMLLTLELGEWPAALLSGLILVTTASLIDTARQMRLDIMVSFFIVLAIWAFVRGWKNPKWFILFGLAFGCAVLTKSAVAVFALVAAALLSLWLRQWSWFRERYFWAGVVIAAALIVPWHLYMSLDSGFAFWQTYIGYNIGTRFAENLFPSASSDTQYVQYLGQFAAPWAQLFFLALIAGGIWRQDLLSSRVLRAAAACASVALVIVGVFFAASTRAPTYLIPMYPFIAASLALGAQEFIAHLSWQRKIVSAIIGLSLLVIGVWSAVFNGFHFNPQYFALDELSREERAVAAMVAAHPHDTWYTYQNGEVGSIMYYSRNLMPLALLSWITPKPGSLILLYNSSDLKLNSSFPGLRTKTLYRGTYIMLLQTFSFSP